MANLKIKEKWNKVKGKMMKSNSELFDEDLVKVKVKHAEQLKQKP
ncbi:hypothetical protein [Synechococcus sp. CS-1331]|jgi:uncharacterized membrane protein YcgQ (UPF0703/DUF1980 family)|nr:hypothetical protein [Synechococcus sp. CS-1331]